MSTAEIILRTSIDETKAILAIWNQSRPPFLTIAEDEESRRAVAERLAIEEEILASGEPAIYEWWMAMDEQTQHGLANA